MTVKFKIILSIVFLADFSFRSNEAIENGGESCSREDDFCSGESIEFAERENKYSESAFSNRILSAINSSLHSYSDCRLKDCRCYLSALKADLKPFRSGITREMIEGIRSRGVTYVIYGNKLYRGKECMFPSRCSGIEHFIKELLPKLNDTELIINTRDWPQINRHFPLFGPVLSFSKTPDYFDIMYPAWSFWEGGPAIKTYPTGLGRWDLHRKSLSDESSKWPWDKKKSIGFFRGSRTSEKRDALILLSRKRPDLANARYTKNQAWKSSQDTLGEEPAEVVSLEHHCRYKYLFNFRGVAASFRFKHLFLCGSLVIHVGNDWIEFFYPAMQPWVHYVPLNEDATEKEMIDLISFLRSHDETAREIAERGKKFIIDHLGFKEIKCYWRNLLKKYQKLLKYDVELDESLIEIK